MLYEMLAVEMLAIRSNFMQIPAHQKVSKLLRGECFVLNYLDAKGGSAHPKELSEKLAVSTARIASLLNHLEEKRLITRTTDAEDSRQIIVQITLEGTQRIKQIRKDVLEHTARMLEKLGPEDAQEYIRIQKKIYQNFSE